MFAWHLVFPHPNFRKCILTPAVPVLTAPQVSVFTRWGFLAPFPCSSSCCFQLPSLRYFPLQVGSWGERFPFLHTLLVHPRCRWCLRPRAFAEAGAKGKHPPGPAVPGSVCQNPWGCAPRRMGFQGEKWAGEDRLAPLALSLVLASLLVPAEPLWGVLGFQQCGDFSALLQIAP